MDKKEVLRRLRGLESLRLAVENISLQLRCCDPGQRQRLKKALAHARLQVQEMDIAMQVLTPEERLVIHRMCIAREKGAVPVLCQVLQVEKSSIYRRKDRALKKLAEAMGSDGSAASGGCSDLSEWQRSADDAAAPSARKMPGTATGQGDGFLRSAPSSLQSK